MLSSNKKSHYLCPHCNSPDIYKDRTYYQITGFCNNSGCNSWWPWKRRIKHSIYVEMPDVRNPRLEAKREKIKNWALGLSVITIVIAGASILAIY